MMTTVKKTQVFIFILTVIAFTVAAPAARAGAQTEGGTDAVSSAPAPSPPPSSLYLVSAEPPEKPLWTSEPPESAEFIYFTGMGEATGEAEARSAAYKNGVNQAAGFYGNLVKAEASEHSVWSGDSEKTITELITYDEKMSSYIDTVVSGVKDVSYYTEHYRAAANREFFKVWVLCRIDRKKAEQDIADFAKNISEPYTSLLVKHDTANQALLMYGKILGALEQNPLHRAVAYYDSSGGRVNFYEYVDLQLNTLADGIRFAPVASMRIQKTAALETTVTVHSPLESTGRLNCVVSIHGTNAALPLERHMVAAGDVFLLALPNLRLEVGLYTVHLELILTEISPSIRKNPAVSFGLEVTPASAFAKVIVSGDADGIGETEKTALVQALQRGIETYGVPVSLRADAAEHNGSGFTVTLALRKQPSVPPLNRPLTICDAILAFSRNGSVRESATKRLSELDSAGAVRGARKFIEENRGFFENVKRTINN
jgi:hypothetical protein